MSNCEAFPSGRGGGSAGCGRCLNGGRPGCGWRLGGWAQAVAEGVVVKLGQTPSRAGPGHANDTTREKQIPFRKSTRAPVTLTPRP